MLEFVSVNVSSPAARNNCFKMVYLKIFLIYIIYFRSCASFRTVTVARTDQDTTRLLYILEDIG